MQFLIRGLAMLLLVGVGFFAGLRFGGYHETSAQILPGFMGVSTSQPEDVDFSPVWKAWNLLEQKFAPASTTEALTDEDRVWGMIEGLAESYGDPYTTFLPPAESEMFAEEISGAFGGVGMEVGMREGVLSVIAPLKDTPAEKAGLLPGDLIIAIDGEPTEDMTVDMAVRKIRGEIGTEVVLKVAREGAGEFMDITVKRDSIKIPTMKTDRRADGIFVIELYNFGATAPSEFQAALRQFVQSGYDKLIIDLRGNPGGYLEASIDVASWFLPIGKVIVQEQFSDERETEYYRSRGPNVHKEDWQVVVLIDGGSASASEIVAGALREHDIATLIGAKTFGKGSVQELVDVTRNTSLKITIARWLTPLGHSISENGLEPDIEVEMTLDDIQNDRDPQLEKAVEFLLNGGVLEETLETNEVNE